MIGFVAYLLVAYAVAGSLAFLAGCLLPRGTRWRSMKLGSILALPLLPYLQIAALTVCFGPSLRPAVQQAMRDTRMMGDQPRTLRVMRLTPKQATVYITEPCGSGVGGAEVGELLRLRRTGRSWRLTGWEAIWSDCGSADGNTFPPFPEAEQF